jgi:hypothetical protein
VVALKDASMVALNELYGITSNPSTQ